MAILLNLVKLSQRFVVFLDIVQWGDARRAVGSDVATAWLLSGDIPLLVCQDAVRG